MRRRLPSALSLASLAALVIASLVFALTVVTSLSRADVPASPPHRSTAALTLAGAAIGGTAGDPASEIVLAADPFDPDRSPPGSADDPPTPSGDTTPATPIATIRLLGTVVRGSGSFAICQLQAETPRIVHVGEEFANRVLLSIDQGRAVFRDRDGTRLELSLTTPRA